MRAVIISILLIGLSIQLFGQVSMKGIQIREVYNGPLYIQTTLGGWTGEIRVFRFKNNIIAIIII